MKQVIINVGSSLTVKRLPPHLIPKIRELLIIENPLYKENEKHGHSNYKTSRKLRFISADSKTMPRGFINTLRKLLQEENIDYRIRLKTVSRPLLPILKSNISFEKRPYGAAAVEKVLKRKFGVLQAPTGSGKTVIAIETMVRRNEHTLIVVHTKELMYQWRDRLLDFTDIKEEEIGLVGDGRQEGIKKITVGIINSLQKIKVLDGIFGYVIVDECHRVPSTVFSKFLIRLDTKYMLGLSATPYRRDGLTQVINFFMGDVIHVIKTKKLQDHGHIMRANLKVIETKFSPYVQGVYDYQRVIKKMVNDDDRNNLIVSKVLKQAEKEIGKGVILVISDRKNHCEDLFRLLSNSLFRTFLVTGSTPKDKRQYATEQLNAGLGEILIATGQLIGEGFDLKHLSSIFLTTPIKYPGRLIQYVGRILRKADGKEKATIFDFDDPCWLLKGSFGKRMKTYKEMGVENV